MNNTKKYYPMTVKGAALIGLDNWLDWPYPMPDGNDYIRLFDTILNTYSDLRPSVVDCETLHWVCAINYKEIFLLAQNYFRYSIMKKAAEDGFQQLAYNPPIDILNKMKQTVKQGFNRDEFNISFFDKLREYWRILRTNFGHHYLAALCPSNAKSSCFMVGDRNQKEVLVYCQQTGRDPVVLRPVLFIKESLCVVSDDDTQKIKAFCNQFFSRLRKREPGISDFVSTQFQDDFFKFFIDTAKAFNSMKTLLASWKISELMVTQVGNIYHRILSAAWQVSGGEVTGFTHGNIYTYAALPAGFITGLNATLTQFIVSSKGEKKLLDETKASLKKGMHSNYKVKALTTSLNKILFDSFRSNPDVKEIKHIMIIGYPMDYFYSCCIPENNTMTIFSLEVRMLKLLKKAGYTLIYKAHPDTLQEIEGVFDNLVDEVETRPFEDVYSNCDCIVFPHPFSTTFGFALMTEKPIVLFSNLKSNFWHPDVLPLLEKRCRIVQTSVDELRKIEFDEVDLLNAVPESINLMDYTIVEEFAL